MFDGLITPPPPRPGSTVAVVSPSSPGVAAWPHRVQAGMSHLRRLGYVVKLMPNAELSTGWTAGTGEERARDINEAFADPDVDVILAAIGGNHSAQLLDHLDFDLIRTNPKVFQGYSDVTALLWAIAARAGLQTFHGPALISELGEYPEVPAYTDHWMNEAWSGRSLTFEPPSEWTDEFLDWDERRDLDRPRELQPTQGWRCVREGQAEGPLVGGCLETLMWHVRDTDIWTDPDGAILFLETSEEAPSPAHVDAYLTTLERCGIFGSVAALVVGRPAGYDDERKAAMLDAVARRTDASGIPVLADVDIGHTDPMLTLPFGRRACLNASALAFEVL